MQNQGRIFICLSTQESAAKNDRAEQSEHHLTLVALHNAAPCPDGRKTTRYQNNRIYRWKYYIQVISVWQGPVPATANFQIEVGGDEVGEDQGFGGDEEDHAPPVYAPPYLYPMLFKHSHLLAMSSTHISNSLSLQACSISICTTCQILSTFQSPTNNSNRNQQRPQRQSQGQRPDAGMGTDCLLLNYLADLLLSTSNHFTSGCGSAIAGTPLAL